MLKARKELERSKKKKLFAWILSCSAILLLSIFLSTYFVAKGKIRQVNKETLCLKSGASSFLALLIDSTDGFNKLQKKYLSKYFDDFKSKLNINEQVSVFVVNEESNESLDPLIVICNPGDGEEANSVIQNPAKIKKLWSKKFNDPLTKVLKGSIEDKEGGHSPIMEMIQAVVINSFEFVSSENKRLIIISDMLQNTTQYSHYNTTPDFDKFIKLPYYQQVKTNLSNVNVDIQYVGRSGYETIQVKRHATFWTDYISSMGGNLRLIKRIPG